MMRWWDGLSNGNKALIIMGVVAIVLTLICVFCCLGGSFATAVIPTLGTTP